MIDAIFNLFKIGWGTAAGGVVLLIIGYFLKKVANYVSEEKQRINASKARQEGHDALRGISMSGDASSELLEKLYEMRDKATRKKNLK